MNTPNILILGIGNPLMGDDGIGVHAARKLAPRCGRLSGVRCLDGGTLGYLLAGHMEGTDALIVIDAAQMQAPPGTVRVFENEAMDHFLNTHPNCSVHEVGLADLMAMAALSGQLPEQRALVAVQPQETTWNIDMSEAVAGSMPLVCERVTALVEAWRA